MAEADNGLKLIDGEGAGTITPWEFSSIVESGSSTFSLSSTNPNNGTYAYRYLSDGTGATAYGTVSWTNTDKDEIWVRFYMYISSDMEMDTGYDQIIICGLYDGTTLLGRLQIEGNGSGVPITWRSGYGYSGATSSTNFSLGAWHRVEIKFVSDDTVGGVQLYIDGTSVLSDLDQDTSLEFLDNIRLGYVGDADPTDAAYIDIDDIKIAETQPGVYTDSSGIVILRRRRD